MWLKTLSRTAMLSALPLSQVRIVRGLRAWVAAHRRGACPVGGLADQLGCVRAAAHLHLLLEEVGAAWPEPFAVSPPCCGRLSHDEATLAEMLRLSAAQ